MRESAGIGGNSSKNEVRAFEIDGQIGKKAKDSL